MTLKYLVLNLFLRATDPAHFDSDEEIKLIATIDIMVFREDDGFILYNRL